MTARRILGTWICVAALLSLAYMTYDTISGHCGLSRLLGAETAAVLPPSFQKTISALIADWRFLLILFGALSLPGTVAAIVHRVTQPSRTATRLQIIGLAILLAGLAYVLIREVTAFNCETVFFTPTYGQPLA